jgi:membrane-associated phospholipid phosphatase
LKRRIKASLWALIVITAIGVARLGVNFLPPLPSSVLRDWLTAVLLQVPYWQAGQFFLAPDEKLQERLAAFDRRLLQRLLPDHATLWSKAFALYVEIAYLAVYPLVPLGLAVLYFAHQRHYADYYWTVVLLAMYPCYATTPFVQALPPRVFSDTTSAIPETRLRRLNLQILRHASIQAVTFPSAHVAAAVAASLVLLRLAPLEGLAFALVALSIAVGAVAGRYHYAADVLWGALLGLAVFVGTYWTAAR